MADKYLILYGMTRKELRRSLWRRQNHRCGICNRPISKNSLHGASVNLDHIIPLSRGGLNQVDNLQLTHRPCNTYKGDTMPDELYISPQLDMDRPPRYRRNTIYPRHRGRGG